MNLAARSQALLEGALDSIAECFRSEGGEVHTAQPSEQDVNRVVFALRSARSGSAARQTLGSQVARMMDDGRLVAGAAAALDLEELAGCIKLVQKK
jgi:hypothetical protein